MKTLSIIIPIEPIPKQSFKKGYYDDPEIKRFYKRLKGHRETIAIYCRMKYKGEPYKVYIYFKRLDFFMSNIERSDWDNLIKQVGDSIEGILIKNDKMILGGNVRKYQDKENPRIEMEIEFLEQEKA